MSDWYFTVLSETENVIVIERSKFICNVKGVENEEDAKQFIELIRKKHSLANHNCYAYIADDKGLIQKFSDAGEPQGTAGLPMLEVLKNKKMYKTVAVVTRYFGGIKLGTGGLTRAYGGSVSECLNHAKIADMQKARFMQIKPDYEQYSRLLKLFSTTAVSVINTEFSDGVLVDVAIKLNDYENFKLKLIDYFNGKIEFLDKGSNYYNFG